ncbi:MAG: tyrosine-type recombinase/integrase [Planctomycetota bacterium]
MEKYCPTAAEVERIAQAAGGIVGRMIRVQFACGLRPGELLAMRWCDLRPGEVAGFLRYLVPAEASKVAHHGRALEYVVPASLLDGLVPAAPAARVFEGGPRSREVYNSALRRACKAAGVQRVVGPGVRHAAITEVARVHGVVQAQGCVSHSNIATTTRYVHRRDADRYAAAAGLAAKLAQ